MVGRKPVAYASYGRKPAVYASYGRKPVAYALFGDLIRHKEIIPDAAFRHYIFAI